MAKRGEIGRVTDFNDPDARSQTQRKGNRKKIPLQGMNKKKPETRFEEKEGGSIGIESRKLRRRVGNYAKVTAGSDSWGGRGGKNGPKSYG